MRLRGRQGALFTLALVYAEFPFSEGLFTEVENLHTFNLITRLKKKKEEEEIPSLNFFSKQPISAILDNNY